MRCDYNRSEPLVMHVDLNSAFATIEQQSRPLLRGRPVAIINRNTEYTAIVTASYEAKAVGVKAGMKFIEAKKLAPDLLGIESDPPKYRYVYKKLMDILMSYSSDVVMKSIDEGVIDFKDLAIKRPLVEVGYEIKERLKKEVGSHMRCNVGIGPNRFLAKTAAGLHKPDGLDVITADNLREVYSQLKLVDLTGIAEKMEQKLNAVGIYTPLEFLDASEVSLSKVAFRSIIGSQWYYRLRGYEVDDGVSTVKTIGRQYVLEDRNLQHQQILSRLHNLCESVGYRLRSQNLSARGVYVYAKTDFGQFWHRSRLMSMPFYSDRAINNLVQDLFRLAPDGIREIGVRCYDLGHDDDRQLSIFGDEIAREKQLTSAIDNVNNLFGERTIHAASTIETNSMVKVKVPFGSTRYL